MRDPEFESFSIHQYGVSIHPASAYVHVGIDGAQVDCGGLWAADPGLTVLWKEIRFVRSLQDR